MELTLEHPDRRRRDLRNRLNRATYPMRHAVGDFIYALPCNFVGHRWVEASRTVHRVRAGRKMIRFKCARCHIHAGFTS